MEEVKVDQASEPVKRDFRRTETFPIRSAQLAQEVSFRVVWWKEQRA